MSHSKSFQQWNGHDVVTGPRTFSNSSSFGTSMPWPVNVENVSMVQKRGMPMDQPTNMVGLMVMNQQKNGFFGDIHMYIYIYIYIHMLICNQIDRSCWVPNRHKVRMDNFASFSARFSFGLPERKWSGLNSIDKIYIHWFILHGVYGLRVKIISVGVLNGGFLK